MKIVAAALLVFGAALAPGAAAQDGGTPPAPGPAPAPAPAAQAKKAAKEPSRAIAGRIDEALKGLYAGSAASRLSARAALESAVADWAEEAKEDPLRAVKWWKSALGAVLPATNHRAGISEESYAFLENRTAKIWVSIPKSYSPKGTFPMVLSILDKSEDPKRAIPALYGELLKDWIVVALSTDPKESGIDIAKEPWLAAVGLRYAVDNLRIDRDRVVLDASANVSNLALGLGSEWAVQFAGCILRGPSASSPLVSNLGLCGTLLLVPDSATETQKMVSLEIAKAVPGAVVSPEGKQSATTVQEWLAKLPPRKLSNSENSTFSWKTRPQGGEPWAYWLWVFRAADAKKDKLVSVTLTRDAAGGTLDLVAENLAEGILLVNDDLIDLDREVKVRVNGKEVWRGKPARQIRTAVYWIGQTGERTLFVPAEIRFTVAGEPVPAKKEAAPGSPVVPPPPPPPPTKAPKGGGDGG
jgi:hypothetical protein